MTQMNLSMKQIHPHRKKLRVAKGEGDKEVMDWESGISGYKLLYIRMDLKKKNYKVLLYRRGLLFSSKAITNLDSVLKSRDVTLLTKVFTVKAKVFPVVT